MGAGEYPYKGKTIDRKVGDIIDNPKIAELEKEIARVGPTDVDETVWISLKEGYNISILQDLTQDTSMTYADVVKLFEGSSSTKKIDVSNKAGVL